MENVLDKSCGENENTHFILNNFFRKLHRFLDNSEKCGGDLGATYDKIWCIRVACWISKATRTYGHAHAYALGFHHALTHIDQ
jgi:hypothetical protein